MEYQEPKFFQVMKYAEAASGDVIDMVSGNPDWSPPAGVVAGLREYADSDPEGFQYPPSDGLLALRQEIADRRNVSVDRVIITHGAGEANYLAMAAALEHTVGSEILLLDPVYPYYVGKANMLGADPRLVPTHPNGDPDIDAIRSAAGDETAAIIINTPNNPTGAVYDAETIRAVAAIAAESDAMLISDEVYDHFDHSAQFTSALSLEFDRKIVTNSFSKSMAITGFRVGYGIFPPEVGDAARARHMLVTVAGSRPAQYAVLTGLRRTGPDYYRVNRERLQSRIETFTDRLETIGATYTHPDGGFYVMATFPDAPGSMDTVRTLIDECGVAGMPGDTFGSARSDWLRFALVTPRVQAAADRLVDHFG